MHNGSVGWRTSMAAEYHEDMCRAITAEYMKKLDLQTAPTYTTIDELGTHTLGVHESKQQVRARENLAAIGGMRRPHLSLVKVPGWLPTGRHIQEVLSHVLDTYADDEVMAMSTMGTAEALGWSTSIVHAARVALEQ